MFELKNSLTRQTVEDAIQQYQRDRDPREKLFEFGHCVVHFALDEHEVRFCIHLLQQAPSDGNHDPLLDLPDNDSFIICLKTNRPG